ncbi:DMT family transporter [Marinomonas agarivorans]|nr:DMT family transporter [Marinomonas agarivorans]
MTDSIIKGVMATIAYAFVMAITGALVKLLQTDISIATLLFWQSCICLIILFPQQIGYWRIPPVTIVRVHILRSLSGFLGFYCYYLALNHIPLLDASLLRASAPLCVPFVVLLIHRLVIPSSRWLPLLIGFIGVAFIIKPASESVNVWHLVGFLSAIGLAFSMVTTRLLSKAVRSQETMFMYFLVSAFMSFVLHVLDGKSSLMLSWNLVLPIIGVGCSLYIGMHLYTMAYSYAPASIVSPVSYIGIVFSGVWGWLLWQEAPDLWGYLGMVLILLSIVLIAWVSQSYRKAG